MSDFKLLEHLRTSLRNPSALTLSQLRQKTKEYQEMHNRVTQHIWSLALEITKASGEVLSQLKKEREELEILLKECDSQKAINDLLRLIEDKEKIELGETTISVSTPYAL